MSDLQLRARSTTEIVDAAVQLYRRDAMRYMLITALAYAPWVVLQLVLLGSISRAEDMATPLGALTYIGMFVGFAIMSAVLARIAAADYLGDRREIDETLREVLPRIPAVIASTLWKYVLFVLGLLLFIVGGLYVITRYFATTQAIVLEGVGTRGAFARSTALTAGIKRHVFNTLALVWIIYFVASMAVSFVGMLGGEVGVAVASTLFTVVAYPIIAVVEVLLYYDARVRKEGLDIEMMAESLDPAPAAAH